MNKTLKESEEIMNDELVETEPLHELVRKIADHDTFVAKTTLRMDAEYAMLLHDHASVLHQAADELITARNREDALQAEVERLREVLADAQSVMRVIRPYLADKMPRVFAEMVRLDTHFNAAIKGASHE